MEFSHAANDTEPAIPASLDGRSNHPEARRKGQPPAMEPCAWNRAADANRIVYRMTHDSIEPDGSEEWEMLYRRACREEPLRYLIPAAEAAGG